MTIGETEIKLNMNKEKYENAILYFLETVNNSHLGKVKLMKLVYYLDFDHFEKYGASVTGDIYRNKAAGPVPDNADAILQEMKEKGLIDIRAEQIIDFIKYKYRPLVSCNPGVFKPSEAQMLHEVAQKWEHHSRAEIVEASHGEAPWIATRASEPIPYALAYYRGKYDEPACDADETEATLLARDS